MSTKSVFGIYPNEALPIGTGLGNISKGGAVSFKLDNDSEIVGASLLLKGYTGDHDQKIKVELYEDNGVPGLNQPGYKLANLTVPAANDGAVAEFTCLLPAPLTLAGGRVYWLLAFGELTETAMQTGVQASWLSGGTVLGNGAIVETKGYINGNFVTSYAVPVFSLLVAA